MMNFKKRTLAIALSTLIAPMGAHATNGMFLIGFGEKAQSIGGAAIAYPQDAMASAANPANMTWVDVNTMRVDVGAELFLPSAEATLDKGTDGDGVPGASVTSKSRANTFLIPNMGMAMKFNRKITMGMTAVGAGGGGSRYPENFYNTLAGVGDTKETLGVNLMVMQMNPTASYKVNKTHSIGASLIASVATFRAFGVGTNFGNRADCGGGVYSFECMSNQGNDWSYGAGLRLGWMGRFLDNRLNLGVSGSTKVYMTEFDKYIGLFPDQGDMDTPAMFGVGMSYKLTNELDVVFDVTRTLYSGVNAIGNPGPNPNTDVLDIPGEFFGEENGAGFGWDDQTIYKLGFAYQYDPKWTLRAGWNYGKSPIPEERAVILNIVAPATTEHHLTLGATYQLGQGLLGADTEVSFLYVHAFEFEQYGPTYLTNQATGQSGFGKIGMSQNVFGVSFGLKM